MGLGSKAGRGAGWRPWVLFFSSLPFFSHFLSSQARVVSMGWVVSPALHCHGLSWVCEARTLPAGTVAEFSEPIFQSNY